MEEIKNEEKSPKKNHVVLLTVVVVLLLFAFLGIGYALGSVKSAQSLKESLNEKEKNQEVAKEDNKVDEDAIKELDINDSLVTSLYQMVHKDYNCHYMDQVLTDLREVGNKITMSNMTTDYKGSIVYDYLTNKNNGSVSEDEMKIAYEKVFGPNTYQVMNTINFYSIGTVKYDSSSRTYTDVPNDEAGKVGCVTHQHNREVVIGAEKNGSNIFIKTVVLYNMPFATTVCKDLDGSEQIPNLVFDVENSEEAVTYMREHKDELHQLTYTFTKASDGNYYYTQVERTK